LSKKKMLLWLLPALLLAMAVIQFIPSAPVIAPVTLPLAQRAEHRLLAFEGIVNFRDLGGYRTADNRTVKWGKLYRSGSFAQSSRSDLQAIQHLGLATLIDFRSAVEKDEEPSVLPDPHEFSIVELPTLDDGNKALLGELMERIRSGDFEDFDPNTFMLEASRQFAITFTPSIQQVYPYCVGRERQSCCVALHGRQG